MLREVAVLLLLIARSKKRLRWVAHKIFLVLNGSNGIMLSILRFTMFGLRKKAHQKITAECS